MATSLDSAQEKKLDAGACKIITSIYQYMKRKSVSSSKLDPEPAFKRTVSVTGLSRKIVFEVLSAKGEELPTIDDEPYVLKTRKPKQKSSKKLQIDKFDMQRIRNIILELHLQNTYPKDEASLITHIDGELNCNLDLLTLKSLLSELGFKEYKNKVFLEKHSVRLQRIRLIKDLQRMSAEGKHIVYIYTNELIAHNLVLLHAADMESLSDKVLLSYLLPHEVCATANERYDHICDIYHKWLVETLLPTLKTNSVLVLEKQSKRMMSLKTPDWLASKSSMIEWLSEHGIQCNETVSKTDVYSLIRNYRSKYIEFQYGIPILQLPCSAPSLNPLESVWKKIIDEIDNPNGVTTVDPVEAVKLVLASISQGEWESYIEHSHFYENMLLAEDAEFDEFTDTVLGYSPETSETESSDTCYDPSDQDTDDS